MNSIGKKWMAQDLYAPCMICDGAREIPPDKFHGHYERIAASNGNIRCPGCDGKGFASLGISIGQLERLRAEVDRLKALLAAVEERSGR